MDRPILANFTVTITSCDHASWQGYVEIQGTRYEFQSEMQLLQYILDRYPALQPEVKWGELY